MGGRWAGMSGRSYTDHSTPRASSEKGTPPEDARVVSLRGTARGGDIRT